MQLLKYEDTIGSFLNVVCSQIRCKNKHEVIRRELEEHILDAADDLIKRGMNETDAIEKAISNMGDPKEIGKKLQKTHQHRTDLFLIISAVIIVSLGLVSIIAFYNNRLDYLGNDFITTSITRYIVYACIGFLGLAAFYFFDYRKIKKYYIHIYILSTLILLMSLCDGLIGGYLGDIIRIVSIKGKPGIVIFSTWIQTIYMGILMYLIAFSGLTAGLDKSIKSGLIHLLLLCLSLSMCYLHNSPISALIIILASLFMLINNNAAKSQLILTGSLLITLFFFNSSTSELTLNGLFIYIVSNVSLLIGLAIITFSFIIMMRLFTYLLNIKDKFGLFVIIGVMNMFAIHLIWNIGMNYRLLPAWDAPIPLIGYGGSSIIVHLIALGIALNIYRQHYILVE